MPTELHETFNALGITQHRVAQLFGVGPRSVRRWQSGDRRIPRGIVIVLRLMAMGAVTIAQVEQAPSSAPARTNCSAILVDPEPTTAEKVYALTPEACRWPCGDPSPSDF